MGCCTKGLLFIYLFSPPTHLGGFEGGWGCVLMYLQREGGLDTRAPGPGAPGVFGGFPQQDLRSDNGDGAGATHARSQPLSRLLGILDACGRGATERHSGRGSPCPGLPAGSEACPPRPSSAPEPRPDRWATADFPSAPKQNPD